MLVQGIVSVLCCLIVLSQQQFTFPNLRLNVGAQVDGEGRVFVAGGRQLLRLSRDLVLQQNVSLSSDVARMSLGSGGESLVVCTENGTCAVYNSSHLSAGPSSVWKSDHGYEYFTTALFTSENAFYVGSFDAYNLPTEVRLAQYGGLQDNSNFVRSMNYAIGRQDDIREMRFGGGFVSGGNAYFITEELDSSFQFHQISYMIAKMIRVCDNGCSDSAKCSFNALYVETIKCGSPYQHVCGVQLMEKFAGTEGPSMILSKCGERELSTVCLVPVAEIDAAMESKFTDCRDRPTMTTLELFGNGGVSCTDLQLPDMCNIFHNSAPAGIGIEGGPVIFSQTLISPGIVANLLASIAVNFEGYSLVVIAYCYSFVGCFTGIIRVTDTSITLDLSNVFEKERVSSSVFALHWEAGLDYVIATTDTKVLKVPLEACSSNTNFFSCFAERNPLCGWCVLENRCSRQTQCQNVVRWIPSSSSIPVSITPDKYPLDDQHVLNVTIEGPGLPAGLESEIFSCCFEDSMGRFNITVPAVEVTPGRSYTCDIRDEDIAYDGIRSAVNFSFVSFPFGIPFDTSNALTFFQCDAADNCSGCLEDGSVCGWCQVNKICRGTDEDCRGPDNFLQLGVSDTFCDVCPLLDGRGNNYVQHVRVDTDLQLTTKNLPDTVAGFNYTCHIKGTMFSAIRNNQTSLTCEIDSNEIILSDSAIKYYGDREPAEVSIFWVGQDVNHKIDSIYSPYVVLYDCGAVSGDCSACVSTSIHTDLQCGWCSSTSPASCRVQEECAQFSLITDGLQCPSHVITEFSPSSGPPRGGTVITIKGENLGVAFKDFSAPNSSITVGGESCTPLSEDYIIGARILCRTNAGLTTGDVTVTLQRSDGSVPVTADGDFTVTLPTVSSVSPDIGPRAGGSSLRVEGTGLDVGNSARVFLNGETGPECLITERSATVINCITPGETNTFNSGQVVLRIDDEVVENNKVLFSYRPNPTFTSVRPNYTIASGGIMLTFTGNNLDVTQNPQLVLESEVRSPCFVVSFTFLNCTAPPASMEEKQGSLSLSYRLELDDAPFPDVLEADLQLMVRPDPTDFMLLTESVGPDSYLVEIQGSNFDSVLMEEIGISVGGLSCGILSVAPDKVNCTAPSEVVLDEQNRSIVNISIGENLSERLQSRLLYILPSSTSSPSSGFPNELTIFLAIGIPVIGILIFCVNLVVWFFYRASKKKNKKFTMEQQTKLQNDALVEVFTKQLSPHLIIASDELRMLDISLGQGEFGIVYKAHLVRQTGLNTGWKAKAVAVKLLKGILTNADILNNMVSEVNRMQDLSHPNVMSVLGVCVDSSQGPSIVMPYMANGSLLNYLKKERSTLLLSFDAEVEEIVSVRKLLLRMCHQISLGMCYLTLQRIVHRDLAARNCMLDGEGNVKVADFGLSEDVYSTGYFRQDKNDHVKLPFKWMAPESMTDSIFNEKTDVWSFGVTCWEVFSIGKTPYPGIVVANLPKLLEEGLRLESPPNPANASEIFSIMYKCWKLSPEERLSFEEISTSLERRLGAISGYLELQMVLDIPADPDDDTYNIIDGCEVIENAATAYLVADRDC